MKRREQHTTGEIDMCATDNSVDETARDTEQITIAGAKLDNEQLIALQSLYGEQIEIKARRYIYEPSTVPLGCNSTALRAMHCATSVKPQLTSKTSNFDLSFVRRVEQSLNLCSPTC